MTGEVRSHVVVCRAICGTPMMKALLGGDLIDFG